MFAGLKSVGLFGLDSYMIKVEADVSAGLPAFNLVGLPDTAIRESRDRVHAAVKNSGFKFPTGRITVNLAPADRKKEGSVYDLPILISILIASGQLKADISDCIFLGEVSLDGKVRSVRGVLAMALTAREEKAKKLFVPAENAAEGAVAEGLEVYGVENVAQLIRHLRGEEKIAPAVPAPAPEIPSGARLDFSDVRGHIAAKKALETAAAGGHNILMIGPPGSGKSMLATRLPTILPEMTLDESIETAKIHSVAGILNSDHPLTNVRPFRSPHHTISTPGLTGGGTVPHPGEISLAHNGVLFLDELPEFTRGAMEALRQPIESGCVTVSRASGTVTFPSNFMLVAAMNPCPCGFFGHPTRRCTCAPGAVNKYLGRISGPMLDRIDLQIEVPPVDYNSLSESRPSESSAEIKERVCRARELQQKRYAGSGISCNARLTPAMLREFCVMTDDAAEYLKASFDKLGLSARAYDRILKVARTCADLSGEEKIGKSHILTAIRFRSLDRKYWGGNGI